MPYNLENSSVNARAPLATPVIVGANVGDYLEVKAYANAGNSGDSYRLAGVQIG